MVWHLLAADAPPSEEAGQAAAAKAEKGRVRWDIFKLPAALCVPWCHVCDNNAMYSLAMLAPTVFTTRLGLAPEHLGPYLAIPPAINVFVSHHDFASIWVAFFSRRQRYRCPQGAFGIAGLENFLSSRGMPLVK